MQYTGNLGLKKPEGTDVVNIDDLNQNFDILDAEVTKLATASQAGRMSAADKVKLDGIESGAQRNTVTSVNNKTGAVTLTASDVGASPTGHTHTFAEITSKPTTLSGYGITDAIPASQKGSANGVASLDGSAKVPTTQLPSASTTQAGIVQLNNTLTSTSTTQAATANAVKQVNDAVAEHLADYVKHPGYGVATGSANAYTVTLNPAPTAYVDGMAVSVKINVDSTGPSTLNVNGLGAKPLKKANGSDATNLKTNGVYTFRYNASTGNFILQGEGGGGTAQPEDVAAGKTFTNDYGEQVGTSTKKYSPGDLAPYANTGVFPVAYVKEYITLSKPLGLIVNDTMDSNYLFMAGSNTLYKINKNIGAFAIERTNAKYSGGELGISPVDGKVFSRGPTQTTYHGSYRNSDLTLVNEYGGLIDGSNAFYLGHSNGGVFVFGNNGSGQGRGMLLSSTMTLLWSTSDTFPSTRCSGTDYDASGHIYVVFNESGNIYKLNVSNGTLLQTFNTGLSGINGIFIDRINHKIYVSYLTTTKVYDLAFNLIRTVTHSYSVYTDAGRRLYKVINDTLWAFGSAGFFSVNLLTGAIISGWYNFGSHPPIAAAVDDECLVTVTSMGLIRYNHKITLA